MLDNRSRRFVDGAALPEVAMWMRRSLSLTVALLVPAAARAQIAEALGTQPPPPSLSVLLEGGADSPEFAAQRAATVLQNVAEVVRQLGAQVTTTDTTALGVARTRSAPGVGVYPLPEFVARYVVRVRLGTTADIQTVSAALERAGATTVLVEPPRAAAR
jgi:hypothetical protein